MQTYLDKLKPQVANAWRTDELSVKIRGNMKYLYAIMDNETRFWIAQQVADTMFTAHIKPLFRKAKEITGKRSNALISDGARNYNEAFKNEFSTRRMPRSRHVSVHYKMERLNGGVRDQEKVIRGLKIAGTSVLPGYQIYHNFVRPREGIGLGDNTLCGNPVFNTLFEDNSSGSNKGRTVSINARALK
jgi:putative transposase